MDTSNKKFRKNIVIMALCLAIFVFSILFVFWNPIMESIEYWNNKDYSTTSYGGATEVAMEAVASSAVDQAVDAVRSCEGKIFYGDTGYLVKGALLDSTVKASYDNMPDTIALIHYGDQLEQAEQRSVDFDRNGDRFEPLKAYGDNHALTAYLKLAGQGKLELLKLMPNPAGHLEVEDRCDFGYRYGDYFDPKVPAQRNTPLAIKKTLIEYFKTDEGADFRFVNDRRNPEQVYRLGSFTGEGERIRIPKMELAVILTEQNAEGSTRERILIVGYNEGSGYGRILFNEPFYSSKLLINVYDNPADLSDTAWSLAKFITPGRQLIEVKDNHGETIYLYYDEEFDVMVRKAFPGYGEEEGECGGC